MFNSKGTFNFRYFGVCSALWPVSWPRMQFSMIPPNKPFSSFQGNNAYIFPAVALGVMCCGSVSIPDELFLQAAEVNTFLFSFEYFFVRCELVAKGSCR